MNLTKLRLRSFIRLERIHFSRYNRAHPHFKRNISIDAFISIFVVMVAFHFLNLSSERNSVDRLLRSGALAMTATDLVNHVQNENISAYWLGPLPGYTYTIICKDRSHVFLTYLPPGSNLKSTSQVYLSVETFPNLTSSDLSKLSNIYTVSESFITSGGDSGMFHGVTSRKASFNMYATRDVVEIQYPTNKRIYDAYSDGEKLRLVSEFQP
jgi:hypothetical protein